MERRGALYLTFVAFLVGLLVVMQARAQLQARQTLELRARADQNLVVSGLIEANASLRKELDALEREVAKYKQASEEAELQAMVADLNRMRILNGLVEVAGPGIEVWIGGAVSPTDMQDLLNELRNAGAEALTLNDQRIVAWSTINGYDMGLVVDGIRTTSPYYLRAIGDGDALKKAMERKGGLLELLRYNYPNLSLSVIQSQRLVLPVYQGKHDFVLSRPKR